MAEGVAKLRQQDGEDILFFGSGDRRGRLVVHDLVDKWRPMVHPVVVGKGKRLFGDTEEKEPAARGHEAGRS